MTHRFASRFRTLLPLAVALSLIISIFSLAPNALAAVAPTIGSVTPSSGTTAGGVSVTITGTDFQIPGFLVKIDGVTLSYSNYTNTTVTVTTPAHAVGTVTVSVTTDLGTATAAYTYVTPFGVTYLNTGYTSGTPPTDPNPYMSGDLVTVLGGGTLVKTGYLFGGWQDCVINHVYGTTFTITGNTDMCPLWTPNTYTVTYDGNGNTSGTVPVDSTAYSSGNAVIVLGQNTIVRTGYTFGGWNSGGGMGPGTTYQQGQTFTIASNTTLSALWTANVAHTVTFNSNYGGGPGNTTQTASVPTNLTTNGFTRTGYTFNSWNSDPAGGGMGLHYVDGASYGFAADMTVYAQWTANGAHTVTFNSNYGTPTTTTQTSSVTANLTANGFTRTGYTFNSWNTDPAGGGMGLHFLDGASYGFAADMTVYAQWTPIAAHTVTFNSNYGTPTTTTQTSSVTANLTANSFTRTGYTFNSWNTDPAGGGMGLHFLDGASYGFAADMTLYAQWTAIGSTFTITYVGNGNTGGTAPSPTVGSGSVTLATNSGVFVKTGSTFSGWNTTASGSGTSYAVGGSYNLMADVTLYAKWIAVGGGGSTFTITYLGNGNTSGYAPVPTIGSGSVTLAINTGPLVKTGFTFSGWNTTASGSGISYAIGSGYNLIADVTLYAKWIAVGGGDGTFTITYDGNGNTAGVSPSPTIGSGAVALAHNIGGFIKTGSNFGGWNTNADGSGTSYAVGGSYNLIANITMYAVWTVTSIYTITYIGNGNTGGSVPTPTVGSGSVTLPENTGGLVETGEKFIGWNFYANGLGTLRAAGSTYLLGANVTLYATYAPTVAPKNAPSLILKGKIVVTAPPKKIALNQIVPVHQQFVTKLPANAVGFELYQNGKLAIKGKTNSIFLKQIVGPKDQVTVVAVGKNGLKSRPAPVAVSKDPISLANINFNTDSYKFIGIATQILDKVAAVMIQHGYTHLDIWGYVDTQGSKASWITLSNNRAKAVNNYMSIKLKGKGITIKNAGRAQTQAVGNNNTAAGRALNRRVEIRVS